MFRTEFNQFSLHILWWSSMVVAFFQTRRAPSHAISVFNVCCFSGSLKGRVEAWIHISALGQPKTFNQSWDRSHWGWRTSIYLLFTVIILKLSQRSLGVGLHLDFHPKNKSESAILSFFWTLLRRPKNLMSWVNHQSLFFFHLDQIIQRPLR